MIYSYDISNKELISYFENGFDNCVLGRLTETFIDFAKDSRNIISKCFVINGLFYCVYGRSELPTKESLPKENIFSQLRHYGSSKKYKGVVDNNGNIVIQTIYLSIHCFLNEILLVEGRDHKYGLLNINGEFLLPPIYDKIFEYREFVFAASLNGKIGFYDIKGEVVIPFIYDEPECLCEKPPFTDVAFRNGLACVLKTVDSGEQKFGYITHENTEFFPFIFDYYKDFSESNLIQNISSQYIHFHSNDRIDDKYLLCLDGTYMKYDEEFTEGIDEESDSVNYNDYSYSESKNDILDAYEGDESNRWNTD